MGFFSNILEKLGMKEAAAAPVITPPAAAPLPPLRPRTHRSRPRQPRPHPWSVPSPWWTWSPC